VTPGGKYLKQHFNCLHKYLCTEKYHSYNFFYYIKVRSTERRAMNFGLFYLPLSYKVGPVQHVFYHVAIKIRQLFLHQPDSAIIFLNFEWVLTTANASGTNSLTCLPKHGGARDNKFWPSHDWVLRTLLSFRNHTPSALTADPSRSSYTLSYLSTSQTEYNANCEPEFTRLLFGLSLILFDFLRPTFFGSFRIKFLFC
jgi:hypothetical protein